MNHPRPQTLATQESHSARVPFSSGDRKGVLDLPLPHPLDFDWRFTAATVQKLWALVEEVVCPGGTVVLLGVPTMAISAGQHRTAPSGRVVLLERRDATVKAVRQRAVAEVIQCDLCRARPPRLGGSVVIADPPWYEDEMLAFLWSAAATCQPTGTVVLSLPPVGTRPGISEERARLEAASVSFGLDLISIVPCVLEYETPFFERNALRAHGLTTVPGSWRCGDLALFARVSEMGLRSRPSLPADDLWVEEALGMIQLRLKIRNRPGFYDPSLKKIVGGDVWPTVSRRAPGRSVADVWTSGNRVFRCNGTGVLRTVIRALRNNLNVPAAVELAFGQPLSLTERRLVQQAALDVMNVVKCESAECAWISARLRPSCRLDTKPAHSIALSRAG